MTVNELLARARSAAGKGTKYKLGAGGMFPSQALPGNMNNECDCSGFVCWALAMSRKTDHPLYVKFNQGWINTDAMVHDANTDTGFLSKLAAAKPGCLIVYGKPGPGKVGHVGIVTKVDAAGKVKTVIHCSSGNGKKGDAIQETPPTVFNQPGTIFAWFAGVD
jgi:cell wall-associated NlpC family hydrolase